MAVVEELIRVEDNGTLSFGNHTLTEKTKKSDFEYMGDMYKVKTFNEITKLEKNGSMVYESVPGTAVNEFKVEDGDVEFKVEAAVDSQITLELESGAEYTLFLNGVNAGKMKSNLSGKLTLSIEAADGQTTVKIVKA
ncbi:MAG: endosialidase [Lachnospiraceae bacterium]|nr:endosialidase [Lachnospiraceae bacterium]